MYSDVCGRFPITPNKGNKCIYVIYVHALNAILTTVMKNRSEKYMIRAFT